MKKHSIILMFLLLFGNLINAQIVGCTDPLSINYNPMATRNDGSCKYASVSVAPVSSVVLPAEVSETSGLIKTSERLFTHNDDTDVTIYELDSISGAIINSYPVSGEVNKDWEEIAHDDEYFYIGDFGNNVTGNRTDLRILKISKQLLLAGSPEIENIHFTYSDQTDFSSQSSNHTDFDCEAMIVSQDSIYLFTKQWVSKKTNVYALPKTGGSYTAQLKGTYDVKGLITGATYLDDKKLVVLCGYSGFVTPFLYLLYDFKERDFFSGNRRKLKTSGMGFHQVEGIATTDGLTYYLSNEHFVQQPFLNVPQRLTKIDLSGFLGNYLENLTLKTTQNELRDMIRIYPNPARDIVYIETDTNLSGLEYSFYDLNGKVVLNGITAPGKNRIDTSKIASGIYTIRVDKYPNYGYKLIKK